MGSNEHLCVVVPEKGWAGLPLSSHVRIVDENDKLICDVVIEEGIITQLLAQRVAIFGGLAQVLPEQATPALKDKEPT